MAKQLNNEQFKHLISPFSFDGGEVSCLLLHGYTSSPSDMRPLGEFLAEKGYAVSCPLLPGHGTSIQDLGRCVWRDWYNAVEEEWNRLNQNHRKVFLIGLSMGGSLGLHLAAHNKVDGVVTLASGIKLADWRLPMLPFVKRFVRNVKKTHNSYARGPNRRRFAYEYNPTHATSELVKFYNHLKEDLPEISAPLLLIHSKNDIIIHFKNTEMVTSRVRSTSVKVVALEKAGHIITHSKEKEVIHREVAAFIQSLL